MGCCASATSVFNPISSGSSYCTPREFDEPTPKPAISSKEVSEHAPKRESFVKSRDLSSSTEEVRKDFLVTGVTFRNQKVNDCRKSTAHTQTSFHHSLHSDTFTFDTGNVLSYDGRNKRQLNRDEILMEILKAKIEFGANPNELCTHGGRTCLMCAVLANDFDYAKKLLELGVDINKTNRMGETALSLAIERQNFELANFLRSKGAVNIVLSLE